MRELASNTTLSHYRIASKIGAGGLGGGRELVTFLLGDFVLLMVRLGKTGNFR